MIMGKQAREVTKFDIIPLEQYSQDRKELRKEIKKTR